MSETAFEVLVDHVNNLPVDSGQQVQLFWACGKEEGKTCYAPVGPRGKVVFNHKLSFKTIRKAKEPKPMTLHLCLQQQVKFDVNRIIEKWALELGDTSGRLGVTSSKGITVAVELCPPARSLGSPRPSRQSSVDVAELERQMRDAQRQLKLERARSQLLEDQLNGCSPEDAAVPSAEGSCRSAPLSQHQIVARPQYNKSSRPKGISKVPEPPAALGGRQPSAGPSPLGSPLAFPIPLPGGGKVVEAPTPPNVQSSAGPASPSSPLKFPIPLPGSFRRPTASCLQEPPHVHAVKPAEEVEGAELPLLSRASTISCSSAKSLPHSPLESQSGSLTACSTDKPPLEEFRFPSPTRGRSLHSATAERPRAKSKAGPRPSAPNTKPPLPRNVSAPQIRTGSS
eukprot:EG_transcript_15498